MEGCYLLQFDSRQAALGCCCQAILRLTVWPGLGLGLQARQEGAVEGSRCPSSGPNYHLRCTFLYCLVLLPCRQEGQALARDPDDPAKVIPPDLADVPVSRRCNCVLLGCGCPAGQQAGRSSLAVSRAGLGFAVL